jgi:hypothetical protein
MTTVTVSSVPRPKIRAFTPRNWRGRPNPIVVQLDPYFRVFDLETGRKQIEQWFAPIMLHIKGSRIDGDGPCEDKRNQSLGGELDAFAALARRRPQHLSLRRDPRVILVNEGRECCSLDHAIDR